MLYTVKEVSTMSGVTIKTLHHYHKIGLLIPHEISEAGYRYYGTKELERLQQILFYRELEFPLEQINQLLEGEPDRIQILIEQEKLLEMRQQRLERILETLRNSKAGTRMDVQELFQGFESDEAWREALDAQRQHLKETYDYNLAEAEPIDVPEMNEQAKEAMAFMGGMAESLRNGVKHHDEKIRQRIGIHLDFLNAHGHSTTPTSFAAQTQFFLTDDFHLQMLESQQTGLAYYLAAAAASYVTTE
ncbi:MerR family transcriptional regulator [Paenibacillus guangzhouensis]|uniref:MerR family transcriptional regulator n=1 Tax=Paenibacillus guangzhouensis TaxID=1473112 RepID=UPI001267707A|nr:MerR family transcriptional regulator [Paenibacillus guangzhouensis]